MPEQKKEKLDFLKREEIKTMAKDLAFVRELEAQKQREKIASIKLKEDRLAQEKKLEQIPKQVKDKPKKIFPISEKPKIPSRSKKILVRGIIILLFVLFLGVIAWFFWPKEKSFIPESEQEVEEELKIQIPVSSIPEEETAIVAIKGCSISSFDRNLQRGISEDDVKCLQIVLNSDPDTKLGDSGVGSSGNETSYFGPITEACVIKFQEKYADEVLASWELTTGTGFVGSTSRAKLNELLVGAEEEEEKTGEDIEVPEAGIAINLASTDPAQEPETPVPETSTAYLVERPVELGYHIPDTPRIIDTIIIHSVYNSLEGDPYDIEKIIQIFQDYRVTSHYLIARDDSIIYRLVPDRVVAYHAGFSKMPDGSRINIINDFSIGIEMVYTKTDTPT